MKQYKGKIASEGVAMGPAFSIKKRENVIEKRYTDDVCRESGRFADAREQAKEQIHNLYRKALEDVGESEAAIFETHVIMIDDEEYVRAVLEEINRQRVVAEYAVAAVSNNFAMIFEAMEDEYMKSRAADIKDISQIIIEKLQNEESSFKMPEPSVIVADDLMPSEIMGIEKNNILAIVLRQGSTNAHAAILARNMDIPAIIGVDIDEIQNGTILLADGYKGLVCENPDEKEQESYRERKRLNEERRRQLMELKNSETATKSGKKMNLYANIGTVADLVEVMRYGAEGIGLFRSEFLYLKSTDYPTEESQYDAYKTVVETMAGKPVIIRTMDIGGDKKLEYLKIDKENNPALGYRALRICFEDIELFKTQLRALYRASAFGNMSIMFPMVTSVWEVQKIKQIIEEVKSELSAKGQAYGNPDIGIMVETPAAVMIADELAAEVDFFSIGTNDLTQYTLAVDRQNEKVDKYYDSHHPAVLKMIKMVADSGHKAGIWVGICGELASDITLTKTFLEMGIDELSVSPIMILPVREKIRELN